MLDGVDDINLTNNLSLTSFLSANEIHIWSACLPENEKNLYYFISILSKDERLKANNFKYIKDQKNFIISRGILRCLLGKYLKEEPQAIEILYGLWGKPCLAEPLLYFNLSHSKDYVLYALTCACEVGIDLEYIDNTLDIENIALSILTPYELDYWRNVKSEDRIHTFFEFWVCKEAFLKASGKGWLNDQIAIPLESVGAIEGNTIRTTLNKKITLPYCFDAIPGM